MSNLIGAVPGNSAALEAFETIFSQDLNNDDTIGIYVAPGTTLQVTSPLPSAVGAATIGAGATLELGTADSASITFSSSTGMLKLDSLTAFTSVIDNFTGNGTLSGSDQIDLKGINFNSVHDSYSNGILTVTDGTNITTLGFNGSYALANFKFASDGNGGTIVYDPPVPDPAAVQIAAGGNSRPVTTNVQFAENSLPDNFHFSNDGSNRTTPQWFAFSSHLDSAMDQTGPSTETLGFSNTAFANIHATLTESHEGASGNAGMDAGRAAQLWAHHSDFHFN